MIFHKMLVLAFAFVSLATLVLARGPTFPIGDGGASIVHAGAAARDVATVRYLSCEGVPQNAVYIASSALPVASPVSAAVNVKASDSNLGGRDDLTIIQTTITTTVITTNSESPASQLIELASTSSLIVAIAAFLSSSESNTWSPIDPRVSSVKANAVDLVTINNVIQSTIPLVPTAKPEDVKTFTGMTTIDTWVLVSGVGISFSTTIRPWTKYWDPVAEATVTYDPVPPTPLPTTVAISISTEALPDDLTRVPNAAASNRDKARAAGVWAGIAIGVWMVARVMVCV